MIRYGSERQERPHTPGFLPSLFASESPAVHPHHLPLNASVHQGLVLGSSERPHLTHTQSFENYVFITPYYLPSLKPYCLLLGISPECAKAPQRDRNGIHDPLFLKTLGPQHFVSQEMALSSI